MKEANAPLSTRSETSVSQYVNEFGGSGVWRGTALQAGRSRVLFLMSSMLLLSYPFQSVTETSTRVLLGAKGC
jgi:hypothetical protein